MDPGFLKIVGRDHHLLGAFHEKTGEPDGIRPVFTEGLNELVGRNLDSEIDDLVAVVAEDDLDQVLADIVDVAFDRGEQDFAARLRCRPFP